MTASHRWLTVLSGTLALVWLLGCGGGEPEPAEPAASESRALQVGQGEQKGQARKPARKAPKEPAIVSKELPPGFPTDVPRHPDGEVVQARSGADRGVSVTLMVKKAPEDVASFYADSFAAEGWTTDIRKSADGTAIFADKAGRAASAVVSPDGDGSRVTLFVVELPLPKG